MLTVCWLSALLVVSGLHAQQRIAPAPATNSTLPSQSEILNDPSAALQLEMTNAWSRVLQIVNKPVRAYKLTPNLEYSTFRPGWFHDGAAKPNFTTVDIRESQELIYAKSKYVTSDLNPGMVFPGAELEFNAMTKYFYTNRSLPKAKLTEPEMVEINRLYRIIGRCESELRRLNPPKVDPTAQGASVESGDEPPNAKQPLARLQSIPQATRVLYGGAGILVLILLVLVARWFKKRSR